MARPQANKYRVTFYSPNGLEQRTIMTANSLPELIKKVEATIDDPVGYFTNDKKNNCYFQVVKHNICYIQYDLLFSDREIHIEKIKELPSAVLQKLLQAVADSEIYALVLLEADQATKERLFSEMDPQFQKAVEQEMKKWGDASPGEIYKAQEIVLEELIRIVRKQGERG
ncbi:MAG: FliG C-terminal domain-containing protein [Ectobacillus sp.]